MKLVITREAFLFDGKPESVGALIQFVGSHWDLALNVEEKVMGEYTVSFYYPNNDGRVTVKPGHILYKGDYGAFDTLNPSNTYEGVEIVDEA